MLVVGQGGDQRGVLVSSGEHGSVGGGVGGTGGRGYRWWCPWGRLRFEVGVVGV